MRTFWASAFFLCALALSGCSGMPAISSTDSAPNPLPGMALQGRVHGGQQPISGASVYLYAANTTGYGNASVSLLKSTGSNTHKDGSGNYYVTTDSSGNFTITGDYSCPGSNAQVYIYSVGGNAGSGANSAAGLLAALGPCATPITTSFIFVDEVSTIATAYAIAGYATDATHVSSSGSSLALTGVANAFANVSNLEALATGQALSATPAGNGTVPQTEINTLANILAACINSTGPSSTDCTTLLSNARNGSITPSDTASAAINIAHNPAVNIAPLFGLQTPSSPFQPDLGSAPNDFTLVLSFAGGGLNGAQDIAVDRSGNVWAANANDVTISEFSPLGAAISGSGGFSGGGLNEPLAIAIDASGDIWTNNYGSNALSEFNSNGSPISTSSGYRGGGLDTTSNDLAIDASGNVWVTNPLDDSVSQFNSSGTANAKSPFSPASMNGPTGLAIDASGNIWVSNDAGATITELNSSGSPMSSSGYSGGGIDNPTLMAVDASGNVWVSNSGNNTLSELNSSGTPVSGSGYSQGGLNGPGGVAIDGDGNVFVANYNGNSISEFTSSGTPITGNTGFSGGVISHPGDIAIDGSGNLWAEGTSGNYLVEFVGLASPVVTPMIANLLTPYGAHAVNKP